MTIDQQIRGCNAERIETVKDWPGLVKYHARLRAKEQMRWIFRGVGDATYLLEPSIERCVGQWEQGNTKADIEEGLLRRFQRRAHQYIDSPPNLDERLEWLALMQHHGAPTRLLDWTYSFYVACFFALESARAKKPCAVWAIPTHELAEAALKAMPKKVNQLVKADAGLDRARTGNAVLACGTPFVLQVTPFRLNERLAVQQGTFLANSTAKQTFLECLAAISTKLTLGIHRIVLHFKQNAIQEALLALRQMNINKTALFPGLDGFAQDMKIFGFDASYRTTGGSFARRTAQM